jgi:biotin carboxylase
MQLDLGNLRSSHRLAAVLGVGVFDVDVALVLAQEANHIGLVGFDCTNQRRGSFVVETIDSHSLRQQVLDNTSAATVATLLDAAVARSMR